MLYVIEVVRSYETCRQKCRNTDKSQIMAKLSEAEVSADIPAEVYGYTVAVRQTDPTNCPAEFKP